MTCRQDILRWDNCCLWSIQLLSIGLPGDGGVLRQQPTLATTEFIAAGPVCVDEIIQTRYELPMLGAPIDGPAWMFGDNDQNVQVACPSIVSVSKLLLASSSFST